MSSPRSSGQAEGRSGHAVAVLDDRIVVMGGHNGENPMRQVQVFSPAGPGDIRGEWQDMPGMLARRAYLSAVTVDGSIYAIGGSSDGRTLNTIEVFDPEKNQWEYWFQMPPMQTKRAMHASAVGGGKLYVCGGFDGMRDLATVEAFDPRTNVWARASNMDTGRSYLACAPTQGFIYAIGGQNRLSDSGPRAHSTVEVFDLYSERWNEAPAMKTGRLGLAASTVLGTDDQEYIYAIGGSDGENVLNTVECFNPRGGPEQRGVWSEAPPMHMPRLGHSAAVVDNCIYVIGGFDGKFPLDTIECFNPLTNRWSVMMKNLSGMVEVADASSA